MAEVRGLDLNLALDPVEETTICATGGTNALAVLAKAEDGGFLHAPDVYIDKIAIGGGLPDGVVDPDRKIDLDGLANGDIVFAATAVSGGSMLKGVHRTPAGITTQSLVMRSKTGTVRIIDAAHSLARKPMHEGRARWPA